MNFKGKRLMPTYLIKFLEEVYPFTRPANFGSRMVTRQFIAETKALYEFVNKEPISNYSRRLVPEYLIKFLEEADYVEFEYESTDYTYEIGATVLKFAEINYIGGMSYVVDNDIQDSPVTSVVSKDADGNTINTFNIPAEIQALEGYGWGINDTYYNYIDFKNKKFIKKVIRKKLRDIDTTWERIFFNNSYYWRPVTNFMDGRGYYINEKPIYLIAGYTALPQNLWAGMADKTISCSSITISSNPSKPYIIDNSSTTLEEFMANNGDLYLYNVLLIPVETNISIDDSFIQVASGGSLTFTNTYEQDVPTSVTYLVEV